MFLTKFLTNLIINSFVFISVYWFFGTELGMAIRATGNNRQMAKTQGINTNKMIIIGLGIANGLIALAGAYTLKVINKQYGHRKRNYCNRVSVNYFR